MDASNRKGETGKNQFLEVTQIHIQSQKFMVKSAWILSSLSLKMPDGIRKRMDMRLL